MACCWVARTCSMPTRSSRLKMLRFPATSSWRISTIETLGNPRSAESPSPVSSGRAIPSRLGVVGDGLPVGKDPVRQFDQVPVAAGGLEILGHTGGGRTQQDDRLVEPGSSNGRRHGVVIGQEVRLVIRFVMAFIHHDQPQVFQRHEERTARPDDHGKVAIADAPPGIVAFAFGKLGMDHADLIGEAREEALDGLGREGDLRYEDQGSLSGCQRLPHGAQGKVLSCRNRSRHAAGTARASGPAGIAPKPSWICSQAWAWSWVSSGAFLGM